VIFTLCAAAIAATALKTKQKKPMRFTSIQCSLSGLQVNAEFSRRDGASPRYLVLQFCSDMWLSSGGHFHLMTHNVPDQRRHVPPSAATGGWAALD
jgi:hypothetical protein